MIVGYLFVGRSKMKDYQFVTNPKDLIGKCFEIRDGKFSDRFAIIVYAFIDSTDKFLVIRCYPNQLVMEYDIPRGEDGRFNLERVVHPCKEPYNCGGRCRRTI